jgi:hypothetical protein
MRVWRYKYIHLSVEEKKSIYVERQEQISTRTTQLSDSEKDEAEEEEKGVSTLDFLASKTMLRSHSCVTMVSP